MHSILVFILALKYAHSKTYGVNDNAPVIHYGFHSKEIQANWKNEPIARIVSTDPNDISNEFRPEFYECTTDNPKFELRGRNPNTYIMYTAANFDGVPGTVEELNIICVDTRNPKWVSMEKIKLSIV